MTTISIDMNNQYRKSYSYDCRNVDSIDVTFDLDINTPHMFHVYTSGSSAVLKLLNQYSYVFKNILDIENINFKISTSMGAEIYNNTFGKFCKDYIEWIPRKRKKALCVAGSNFDDNIVFGNEYAGRKGLTIAGGKGNDTIVGTQNNDKINGGIGNDTITGEKGNDVLAGGVDADTFLFSSGDGIDVIADASNEDTVQITDVNKEDLTFVKNGKNLEIYYDNTFDSNNKIIVKSHFSKQDAKKLNTLISANGEINISEQALIVSGRGKIAGTNNSETILGSTKADKIVALEGDDIINAREGNDVIYGGQGNDTINAGAGKNSICYNLGDGDDTILYGGGKDTLVFAKGTTVTAEYSGDDAIVTYSGTRQGIEYSNKITISDYKNNASVRNIKIGKKTKTLEYFLSGGQIGGSQGSKTYISTEESQLWKERDYYDEEQNPNDALPIGNHTFVFDLKNTNGTNDFGGDGIRTPNSPQSSYVDTLQFKNHSVRGGGMAIEFEGSNFNSGINIYADRYVVNPYYSTQKMIEHNGFVRYMLPKGNNSYSKLNIVDSTGKTYNLRAYNGAQTVNNSKLKTNTITLIMDQALGTSTVVSNSAYNYTSTRNTNLNYTYNGGHDTIKTKLGLYSNECTCDTYTINSLNSKTDLCIYESGGNDTLRFANTNANDIRVLFDVKLGFSSTLMDDTGICYVHKDSVTLDNLKLAMGTVGRAGITGGVYVYEQRTQKSEDDNIDNIATKDYGNINKDAWYNGVMQSVASWLTANNYSEVSTALEQCNDSAKLNQLLNCYSVVKYSDTLA